nr:R-spondin-1-like [Cherax quadricarinatus]
MACPLGCTQCSEINGCLACKPPFFLLLNREGTRQTAFCTRACPRGFYKLKKKRENGFCAKCTMRGCVECLGVHYCSVCQKDFTNFFGKCITQPPENELEELEGIFVTRPPLAFPTSNGATTISRLEPTASILSTSPLPTGAETTNSTTPIRSTTPATSTTLSPASVVTVTSSVIASATAAPEGRDAETIQKGVFIPLFATLSPADRSHTPSTPSYNYDSRPCRRKLNRGKGKRRRKKGRKNRKGNKERRRGNINRRKNCENSQRSESKGHRKRNLRRGRHRGNRRGCRSRKQRKCRDSVVDKNSEGREGETTVAVSEERSITTTENKHKHSENMICTENRRR